MNMIRRINKILALLLCTVMLLEFVPSVIITQAHASQCTHEHTDECYESELNCQHECDIDCAGGILANSIQLLNFEELDDLTISSPRLQVDSADPMGTNVKTNSSKGFFAKISADSVSGDGVNGVWLGFRFELPLPAGMDRSDAYFTASSYSWLMNLSTGTTTATPVYDFDNNKWVLEGKYYYNEAVPLGSSGCKEYSRSIAMTTVWLIEGQTITPTIETWIVDKSGETATTNDGDTITVVTEPSITNTVAHLSEAISGWYSASQKQLYLISASIPPTVTDAVEGRVYHFDSSVVLSSTEGNALIPSGGLVNVEIPLLVTVGGVENTDPAEQPFLLTAHYNETNSKAIDSYQGAFESGFDISYGGRVTPYLNIGGATIPVNPLMSNVSFANNIISASLSGTSINSSLEGITRVDGYYQVFVPVPETDTETTARVLHVGAATAENISHVGNDLTVTNTDSTIVKINVNPITNRDVGFSGAYTRTMRFHHNSATSSPVGSSAPIYLSLSNLKSEMWTEINSYDILLKLDADAFVVNGTQYGSGLTTSVYTGDTAVRYGVLKAGGNFASDSAMLSAEKDDFVFYSPGSIPTGAVVTAILLEARNGYLNNGTQEYTLENITTTTDATKAGSVYQAVMDIDIWAGDDDPATDQVTCTMHASGDNYQKASYSEEGTYYRDTPNHLTADSLLLLAYRITGSNYNLNGSSKSTNTSTFDVNSGERTADFRHQFTIEYLGEANTENPNQEFTLYLRIPQYVGNAVLDVSSLRINSAYTQGATDGSAGVIQGGHAPTSIEESWKGEHSLNWYKVGFTVTGSGIFNIDGSVILGDAFDPNKEVPVGSITYGFMNVLPIGQSSLLLAGNSNAYSYFVITKSNMAGFRKIATSDDLSSNGNITYTMALTTRDINLTDVTLIDVLPFNNDGRGTIMSGSYQVDDPVKIKINTSNATVLTDMEVYYTTDTAIRTVPIPTTTSVNSSSFVGDNVTALGATWYKASKTCDGNGAFSYAVNKDTVAIISVGTIGKNESPVIDLTLQLENMEIGDTFVNSSELNATQLGNPMIDTSHSLQITHRQIKGKAWIDQNGNGAQDDGEPGLAGLTVKLYQGETEITKDEDGTTYNVVTGADGSYKFKKVPSSPNEYHVIFSGGTIQDYIITNKSANNVAEDKNSDVTGVLSGDVLSGAVSDAVYLMTLAQQISQSKFLDEKQLDAGFVLAAHPLTISNTITQGSETKDFTFTVKFADSSNTNLTGTFSYTGSAISGATAPSGGTITLNNGEATITLRHGQSITINNVPLGTKYTVTENSPGTGWTPTPPANASGTMTEAKTVAYSNSYTPIITGIELNVTKTISGPTLPTAKAFTFTLARTDSGAAGAVTMPATLTATTEAFASGSATAVHFGTITFNAVGTYTFSITETASGISGMTDAAPQTVTVTVVDNNGTLSASVTSPTACGELTFTNIYAPTGGGGVTPSTYSVTLTKVDAESSRTYLPGATFQLYRNAGSLVGTYTTNANGNITVSELSNGSYYFVETVAPDGYKLDSSRQSFTISNANQNITVTNTKGSASNPDGTPSDLNSTDHIKYVVGYADGTVRPNANITRAEVTTMFYRLLTSERRDSIFTVENRFADVSNGFWYNKSVASMSAGGYITGYSDGTFAGDRAITRAEFVAIAARFIDAKSAIVQFSDVAADHWAYQHISTAVVCGWIEGYTDGTFKPDKEITRAEAMTVINRMLNRGVDSSGVINDIKLWSDNTSGAWYYYDVIEATNDHQYTGARPSEKWTSLSTDYYYDIAKYEHP